MFWYSNWGTKEARIYFWDKRKIRSLNENKSWNRTFNKGIQSGSLKSENVRLKLQTDPRWVNIVESDIHEILTDHAFCKQKAASTAIYFIVQFPELSDLVKEMEIIAQEEMCHFEMVHNIILERDMVMGREQKINMC